MTVTSELMDMHNLYLRFLSKVIYPPEAIPRILEVLKSCLQSQNYRVREYALEFYHVNYLLDPSLTYLVLLFQSYLLPHRQKRQLYTRLAP